MDQFVVDVGDDVGARGRPSRSCSATPTTACRSADDWARRGRARSTTRSSRASARGWCDGACRDDALTIAHPGRRWTRSARASRRSCGPATSWCSTVELGAGKTTLHPRPRRGARRARHRDEPDLRARAHPPAARRRRAARARRRLPARPAPSSSTTSTSTSPARSWSSSGARACSTASPIDWLQLDIERPLGGDPEADDDDDGDGVEPRHVLVTGHGDALGRPLVVRLNACSSPLIPPPARASPIVDRDAGVLAERSSRRHPRPRRARRQLHRRVPRRGRGRASRALRSRRRAWGRGRSPAFASASPPREPSPSASRKPVMPVVSHDAIAFGERRPAARRHRRAPPRGLLERVRRRRTPMASPCAFTVRRSCKPDELADAVPGYAGYRGSMRPRSARRRSACSPRALYAHGRAVRRERAAVPSLARRRRCRPARSG